jgi:protein-disulfide isomerase
MFWKKHGIEKKDLLMSASVLIGAILISASICWGGGKLSWPKNESADSQAEKKSGEDVKIAKRSDAPSIGSGKVEIIEFSDFQCPYCQKFYNEAYKEIKAKYIDTKEVKLTFRHLPLPFHVNAQKAAEASECANKQDKFFEYHDILFEKGQSDGTGLAVADLKQYARDLGLNATKFNSCLDSGETTEIVKKDLEDGQKAGVSGTPTFFVNGKKIIGAQPFSVFSAAIEEALK